MTLAEPKQQIAYNYDQAAQMMGVSSRQVKRWVSGGQLNAVRVSYKIILIKHTELVAFLDRCAEAEDKEIEQA